MKLVKIGTLVLSLGFSTLAFADKPDVKIGIGRGGIGVCVGDCDRNRGDWNRGPGHGGDHRGGGWDRGPGHGGDHRGGGWDRGPRQDYTVCYARNGRGQTFIAEGWRPDFQLRREAMDQCWYNSRFPQSCYDAGCANRRW